MRWWMALLLRFGYGGERMKSETVRTVGNIYYSSNLKDGQGQRVANDFLTRLTNGFARRTAKYMRVTREVPFVFRERQLHSIIAPTLDDFTDAFLMELPTQRSWSVTADERTSDSHGWIDYWCSYRNISFLVELKHGFISGKSGQIRKDVKAEWETAILQLDAIEEEAKFQGQWSNGTLRVALHVLPLFERHAQADGKPVNDLEKLLEIQKRAMEELERRPNWSAMWKIHEGIAGPYEYSNAIEFYPGVLIVANVSEITS